MKLVFQGRVNLSSSTPSRATPQWMIYLIRIGKNHKDQYNLNYQIGATIEEDSDGKLNITGFFNNQAYHTIAISLSYLGNTLMKCFGNKDYQIETINHPLPRNSSKQTPGNHLSGDNSGSMGFTFCMSFGMAFLFATFLIFLDKRTKVGSQAQPTRERSQTA